MKFSFALSLFIISNLCVGQVKSIPMDFEKSKTYIHNGTPINYQVEGNGKEQLVFLHGFSLSTYSWKRIKDYFDHEKYTLTFIDLKGSGFSGKPRRSNYSIEEQSDIVISLLESININECSFISHSYGGVITLYIHFLLSTEGRKLKIKNTVLLDTQGYNEDQPFFLKALRNPISSFIGLKLTSAKRLAVQTIKNTYHDPEIGYKHFLNQYTFFYKMKNHDFGLIQCAKQIVPEKFPEVIKYYKKINSPFLIVWGEQDGFINNKFGKKLASDIEGAQFVEIQNCGHVPHEEQPLKTYEIINNFLNNQTK